MAVLSLSLLTACSALPTSVVLDETSFKGMSALLSSEVPRRPLHVLIVHGMGTPAPYEFEGFIRSLADRFGLVQIPPSATEPQPQGCYPATPAQAALAHPVPRLIAIEGVPESASAQLYTYAFAPARDDRPSLTVSYLLWAPLTESIKCDLAAEEKDAPPRQAFADFAKDFIDNKLADAVLYGGTYRELVMRPSVQAALCLCDPRQASPDGKSCRHGDYDEPTVIITHSLGGYMMMDAIDDELRRDGGAAHGKSAARKILENT